MDKLSGEVTDALVERVTEKVFPARPLDTGSYRLWKAGKVQAILEEAVREPDVFCKNCGNKINFMHHYGESWRHVKTLERQCHFVAEPK